MMSTTSSTTFSQYQLVRAREPASFWRENVVAVVNLLRILARNKISNVSSFIFLPSGEGVTSFTEGNSANFSSEKW